MMEQLTLKIPPTKEEICMMCHLSSGCMNCCIKCKNTCNAKQACMIKENCEGDPERLEAWLYIIETVPFYKNLKKKLDDEAKKG